MKILFAASALLAVAFPYGTGQSEARPTLVRIGQLPATERKEVFSLVFGSNETSIDLACARYYHLTAQNAYARILRAHLRRGENELLVQASDDCHCAPVGNCSFYIVRKAAGDYDELLSTGMVQGFYIMRASSNGLADIVVRSHGSAFESQYRLFRFEGKRYRSVQCTNVRYPEEAPAHPRPRPIVQQASCWGDDSRH